MRTLALLVALALAGCFSTSDDATPTPTSPTAAAADPVAWPIEFEGRLAQGATACSVTCIGQGVEPAERFFETEAFGVVEMELELEWESTSPSTDELLFGVFTCDPDACDSDEQLHNVQFVEGVSPLFFEMREYDIPEGESMFVWANTKPFAQAGGDVRISNGEALHVEGEIETA
jgi:hypothetical protein